MQVLVLFVFLGGPSVVATLENTPETEQVWSVMGGSILPAERIGDVGLLGGCAARHRLRWVVQ